MSLLVYHVLSDYQEEVLKCLISVLEKGRHLMFKFPKHGLSY